MTEGGYSRVNRHTVRRGELLERHQLDFETHEAITHVIPRVFGEALEVWRVPVASLGVPPPVQVPSDLVGHAVA